MPPTNTSSLYTALRPWLPMQGWKRLLSALSGALLIIHFSSACEQGQTGSSISSWKCSFHHQLGQHYLGKGEIWHMSSWGRVMGPSWSWAPQRLLAAALSTQGRRQSHALDCKGVHGVISRSCKHMIPFKKFCPYFKGFFSTIKTVIFFLSTLSLYHFFKGGGGGI